MRSVISRREFHGLVAGGMALASGLGCAEDGGEKRRVVVGVMGLSRGKALANVFVKQPGVELRYVCDVDAKRAEACAAELEKAHGIKPVVTGDFRRMLDDAEVDGLVCAAPNHWHGPATLLGCAAGKHVYVEKPCCHNPAEGEAMVEAARRHGRVVQVGTQRRSGPGYREAMARLHAGEIGRVYAARAHYFSARGSIGRGRDGTPPEHLDYALWQGPAPERPFRDNVVHYNWHWFWHWGNGELGNNGVHALDLARWGLGVDYPIRVTSSGGRYVFEDDQETPDTHVVAFEFEGGRHITWQGHSCNPHEGDGSFVTFYGDAGTMVLEGWGNYRIYDMKNKEVAVVKGALGEPEHVANFVEAIRRGDAAVLNCGIDDAVKSTLLSHLGNIAHRTGRALQCDAGNGHIVGDAEAMALWKREYAPGWEIA